MAVDIHDFSGICPAKTPWKLPLGLAQISSNINPDSRTIKPWNDALVISTGYTAGSKTTIYRFGRSLVSDTIYWFQWAFDVDVAKGPVVADVTERTMWTGQGAPKWTNTTLATTGGPPYPAAYRDLGVVRPITAPTMTVTGTAASQDYTVVGYAYTNVTTYGEESAPSPICVGQKVFSGQVATMTGFDAAPSGTSSTVSRRLYRTVTSSTDTNLYFVKESANAVTSVVDDVGTNIGSVIQTKNWNVPSPTMFGLTAMANGIMIGFDGFDVCVSAAYAPYAWPPGYKCSTDYPIVGGRALGNSVVVLTTGMPYLLSGTTADALYLTRIDSPEACVSKRSIAIVSSPVATLTGTMLSAGKVFFASQNGLCACDSSGTVTNMTNGIMNRDDWQALVPASMSGYAYNGKYFGFYNTGSVTGGFCFDPRGGDAAMTLFPFYATGGYLDLVQDHLDLQVGTSILGWNTSGTPLTATWHSGVIETKMQTFRFGQVLARDFTKSITFKLYGDGNLIQTETITSSRPFTLNADDKCFQWEVEIITTTEVYEVILALGAEDMREAGAT